MKAVISGATRGIGKAIAKKLVANGYDLVLLARSKGALEECKADLSSSNNKVEFLPIDLSSDTVLKKLESSSSLFKGCSVLINNLGVHSTQHAGDIIVDDLKSQLTVNLYSAIQLSQFVLKHNSSTLSDIVNIGSVMSLKANEQAADYSISKHAFKGWNDALRESLRKEGIKVSAIYPGAVNTSSWDGIEADRTKMIQADDVAEVVQTILEMRENTLIEEVRINPRDFPG